jgi:hypothetical protein
VGFPIIGHCIVSSSAFWLFVCVSVFFWFCVGLSLSSRGSNTNKNKIVRECVFTKWSYQRFAQKLLVEVVRSSPAPVTKQNKTGEQQRKHNNSETTTNGAAAAAKTRTSASGESRQRFSAEDHLGILFSICVKVIMLVAGGRGAAAAGVVTAGGVVEEARTREEEREGRKTKEEKKRTSPKRRQEK